MEKQKSTTAIVARMTVIEPGDPVPGQSQQFILTRQFHGCGIAAVGQQGEHQVVIGIRHRPNQ